MVTQNMLRTHEVKLIFLNKCMILVTDGNSEHVTHAWSKIGFLRSIKTDLGLNAFDLIKCFKQIKWQRLLHTCAPFSELPSDRSSMFKMSIPYWFQVEAFKLSIIHSPLCFSSSFEEWGQGHFSPQNKRPCQTFLAAANTDNCEECHSVEKSLKKIMCYNTASEATFCAKNLH